MGGGSQPSDLVLLNLAFFFIYFSSCDFSSCDFYNFTLHVASLDEHGHGHTFSAFWATRRRGTRVLTSGGNQRFFYFHGTLSDGSEQMGLDWWRSRGDQRGTQAGKQFLLPLVVTNPRRTR